MAIRRELSLRIANSPGTLAGICGLLAEARVSILAMSVDPAGTLRLVVDNHVHAAGVLRDEQHEVLERDVLYIQVPNGAGSFAAVARLLAVAQVNLDYVYGAGLEAQPEAAIIVGVEDAQRAATAAGV